MGGDDAVDEIRQFERDVRGLALVGELARREDGEEDGADATGAEPRQIDVLGGAGDGEVGPFLAQLPRHVFVGVDDDARLHQARGVRRDVFGTRARRRHGEKSASNSGGAHRRRA